MAAIGKGYAKVILFGEHFVVYGLPGIASSIDKCVQIDAQKVKDSDDVVFDDKVYNEKISLKENPEHIKSKLFNAMFKDEEFVPKKGIKLTITATSTPGGGMGYSASLCAAMARAMSVLTDQGWKDDKIFEVTMKGETIAHGTPSGIDPACATYGSLILFEKNMEGGKNKIQPFKLGAPLYLVLADTGIKHDTKEAVMDVRKRKEANPAEYEKIFSDYKTLVGKAKTALKFGETIEVGKLMNENHELLKKIGVSIPEIENIIKVMNYSNALGAKITGAGMGGNVIGLCENEKHQDKMLATLESKGIKAIKTKIN